MSPSHNPERRRYSREAFEGQFKGRELSSGQAATESFTGEVQNISEGGLCLQTDHHIRESSVIQAEVVFPGHTFGVPSLMQVKWLQQLKSQPRYRAGLEFIL